MAAPQDFVHRSKSNYDELTIFFMITQSTKSGLKINLGLLPVVLTGQRIFSLVTYLF